MFERFRRSDAPAESRAGGRTAVAERPADTTRTGEPTGGDGRFTRESDATTVDDRGVDERRRADVADDRTVAEDRTVADRPRRGNGAGMATAATAGGAAITAEHMRTARARQHDVHGGMNWGAAFFGWLVAVGLGAILVGLVAGAGAAIGLTQLSGNDAQNNAGTIGLGGGIVLLVVLMIAYYAGGYVAGRMSRFDGARQGAGAWIVGVIITIILGVVAAILGSNYNVLSNLNLPRIPIGSETLTTGGIIATAVVLLGTLIAAIAGGKVGERYHRRIDRTAVDV